VLTARRPHDMNPRFSSHADNVRVRRHTSSSRPRDECVRLGTEATRPSSRHRIDFANMRPALLSQVATDEDYRAEPSSPSPDRLRRTSVSWGPAFLRR